MKKLVILLAIISLCLSHSKNEWKSRRIYQVLTDRFAHGDGSKPGCDLSNYCGGDFKGLKNNLQYIKGMGFNAIWISPIVDNYDNGYHGYWARNINQINSHFGSEQDLIDLVNECHKNDIWVMVDVVGNHMGNTNQDYSQNVPFNSPEHYHDYCIISDSDFSSHNLPHIQNCRLAGLADLNQDNNKYVHDTLVNWISDLVKTYNFDGIRIDTVPEVPTTFWKDFVNAAGVYAVGEVFDGDMGFIANYFDSVGATLNYPGFFTIRDTMANQRSMYQIRTYYDSWYSHVSDISFLGVFNDNHDNARFMSDAVTPGKDQDTKKKLFKGEIAFTLTSIGIPIIYYGSEQLFGGGNDPQNREALWNNLDTTSEVYQFIATINQALDSGNYQLTDQKEAYVDDQVYSYYRGKMFVGITNQVDGQIERTIQNGPFTEGETICNIFYPKDDCIQIKNGKFTLYLENGEVKIFVPKKQIEQHHKNFLK